MKETPRKAAAARGMRRLSDEEIALWVEVAKSVAAPSRREPAGRCRSRRPDRPTPTPRPPPAPPPAAAAAQAARGRRRSRRWSGA